MKFEEMPYVRVNKEETINEFKQLIDNAKSASDIDALFDNHKNYYALSDSVMTNMTLAQIRHSIDTSDEFYSGENDYYDELLPELQVYLDEYKKAIYNSPLRNELEKKIGKVAIKNIEISFKAFDENLVPLMQEENALITEYQKLIASAKIEFDGKINNISMMAPYMTCSDRETRKAAWKALDGYFLTVTDEIDTIYDKMVKNRTEQAHIMGYKDYVELGYYRMNRNSYNRDMVENFRRQVKESFVPFVSDIHRRRQERIGVDALKCYDNKVYFKQGNPKLVTSESEMIPAAVKMYHELSPETAEFINIMSDSNLFDIFTKPNKQQGGYMTYLPNFKVPFVFGNCNGTFDDVGLITHECGHAFQGYLVRDYEISEDLEITMETAETHSMSMEYFTYNWMDMFFGDRTEDYKTLHGEDSVIFIPYGCLVDEFQHKVYENPDLTPKERKELWSELEKSYRPLLDYEDNEFFAGGGYWQRQMHIFTNPFYYIDYVLASINAMQFKVRMNEDYEGAWQDYLKLCRLSAKGFFTDMIEECGLKSPFEDGTISELTDKLRETM